MNQIHHGGEGADQGEEKAGKIPMMKVMGTGRGGRRIRGERGDIKNLMMTTMMMTVIITERVERIKRGEEVAILMILINLTSLLTIAEEKERMPILMRAAQMTQGVARGQGI